MQKTSRSLLQWIEYAKETKLRPLIEFTKTIINHFHGILAFIKLSVTCGALEGMNNKIKVVSRRAFGYKDQQYFILKIYHCCSNI